MRARSRIIRLVRTAFCLAVALGMRSAVTHAHAPLADYVEHHVTVTVDRRNIDIQVELTFHDMRSLLERRRIDADRSGVITRAESIRYLAALEDTLEDSIVVTYAGTRLDAVLLDEPQLDLENNRGTMGTRHVVRVSWFARTPPLEPYGRLEIEDRLWPAAAASCIAEAGKSIDTRVTASREQEIWRPHQGDARRVLTFTVRFLADRTTATSSQHPETHHATATRPGDTRGLRPDAGPRQLEPR